MFSRLRIALFTLAIGMAQLMCESATGTPARPASAQQAPARPASATKDAVYQYRGANGRQVFTNAGHVTISGEPVAPLPLPELHSVDFADASATQLQQLDRSVQRAHEELQGGRRCQAIRASLRVPTTSFLWREHLRELCVGVALFAIALVALVAWDGRLKRLMPLAPLLGCAYLGYATYARLDRRIEALRDGLHACSSDLPPPQASSASAVKQRLTSASELQATIDRAYAQRTSRAESIMRQR